MAEKIGESTATEAVRSSVDKPGAADVPVLSKTEDRSLLMRIDIHLIPILLFSYLFQSLDKSCLSFSSIMGLKTDLHLLGDDYSWASSIYYFGYLAFSYPVSYLLVRLPIGKLIAGACTLWGTILVCTAGVKNVHGLFAARFFLGAAEAAIAPSLSMLVSMWYKRSEQPLRHGVWFLGSVTAGFFASLLAYAISHIDNSTVTPWQVLFIAFGGATMVWGVCLYFLIPDQPRTARFLSDDQKQKAVVRVAENMAATSDGTFKMYQLVEGLTDVKTWLLFLIMVSSSLSNGLSSFQSIVIQGFGFSTVHSYVVQMIPTAFQVIFVGMAALGSTFFKNTRTYWMMVNFAFGIAGAVMVNQIPSSRLWAGFFGYCLCIAFSGNFPMMFAMSTANFTGYTKKTTVNAALFVGYCAANIASPQFFLESESPAFPTGFKACLVCLCASFVFTALLRAYLIYENKRRDRLYGVVENPEDMAMALGLSDKTDLELHEFRYVM